MKALVVGCGRVGALVAVGLHSRGHEVRVLDANPQNFLRLPEELRDHITLQRDIANEEDLLAVGIEEVDIVVAAAPRDTRNIFVAQIAKHRFGVERVVCHISDPGRCEMYRVLGLGVVSPTQFVVDAVVQTVLQ